MRIFFSGAGLAVLISSISSAAWAAKPGIEAPPPGVEAGAIVLDEREPLALLVMTPRGDVAKTSISDMIAIVSELLKESTDLTVKHYEQSAFTGCKGNWACIVPRVRQDYDRSKLTAPDGTVLRYDEHLARLKESRERYPRFMVYLNNKTAEGKADKLQAFLIDTDAALRRIHDAPRLPGWDDEVSGAIDEDRTAVRVVSPSVALETTEQTRAFLTKLFRVDFQPALEEADHWEPYGILEIDGAPEGAAIQLDGAQIGAARKGVTRIERVRPGNRQLELEHPEYAHWAGPVNVEKGPPSKVTVEMERMAGALANNLRKTLFWSGLGLAAIGVGVTTYAGILSTQTDQERVFCFYSEGSAEGCGASQFISTGYPSKIDLPSDDPNPGLPLAPLGLSLALTGGLWTAGASLFSDDPELPWKETAVGLGLGTVAFVVMILANPENGIQKRDSMVQGLAAQ